MITGIEEAYVGGNPLGMLGTLVNGSSEQQPRIPQITVKIAAR
jgi:hypothetical protein